MITPLKYVYSINQNEFVIRIEKNIAGKFIDDLISDGLVISNRDTYELKTFLIGPDLHNSRYIHLLFEFKYNTCRLFRRGDDIKEWETMSMYDYMPTHRSNKISNLLKTY